LSVWRSRCGRATKELHASTRLSSRPRFGSRRPIQVKLKRPSRLYRIARTWDTLQKPPLWAGVDIWGSKNASNGDKPFSSMSKVYRFCWRLSRRGRHLTAKSITSKTPAQYFGSPLEEIIGWAGWRKYVPTTSRLRRELAQVTWKP
jgi:hypothetical protein